MIPKTIHYCWFGGNPKPKLAKKCIKSWKKKCPDYEIIEWNEDNFDIPSAPLYVRQAYEAKKWAFVTDYVRLFAMLNYGGIYMDTDVEVVKSLDPFLSHKAFSGFEDEIHIPTGIMACEKGFPLFNEFLHYYDNVSFFNEGGEISYVTNVIIMTEICLSKGLIQNNTLQNIDGFMLYPNDYFCPLSYQTRRLEMTENTTTIHWFNASWLPKERKEKHKKELKLQRRTERKHFIKTIPNRVVRRIIGDVRYDRLKGNLKRDNNAKD